MRMILVVFCVSILCLGADRPKASIEVHGHRGARALLPENTLPAFQFALEAGADVLDLDLSITADGVLVVSHDAHINPQICREHDGRPIQHPPPLISALTLAELQRYDCGSVRNPRFPKQAVIPGTRIPTLNEVFELIRRSTHPNARRIQFNIETKTLSDPPEATISAEVFARVAVEAFRESGFLERIVLQSSDPRTLVEARRIEPKIAISLLVEDLTADVMTVCKSIRANIVSPAWEVVSARNVAEFHQVGIRVVPWTVNRAEDWEQLIRMKVDGIITDDPAALLDFLK